MQFFCTIFYLFSISLPLAWLSATKKHRKRTQQSKNHEKSLRESSCSSEFSATIFRFDGQEFSDTRNSESQAFAFFFPFCSRSVTHFFPFYCSRFSAIPLYNRAMNRKSTEFNVETIGTPKLNNIPNDIVDAIIHTLELQISDILFSGKDEQAETSVNDT